jgi:hypothetical protein
MAMWRLPRDPNQDEHLNQTLPNSEFLAPEQELQLFKEYNNCKMVCRLYVALYFLYRCLTHMYGRRKLAMRTV